MCGINLIIDKKGTLGSNSINRMTAATHHRGPEHNDVLEIHASSKIFLGHNRLKIIDKSDAANQPFISECKRYFLIYNGEIFNFQELRNDLLDNGITFKTYSDTEVLLQLLISKGISALPLLEGMFSFIFYDKEKEETLLARDENGIKPLFYFNDEKFFIASSESRGILASGLVRKELNEAQIFHYLKFRFAKAPETFFKGIISVIPGHYILIDKNKQFVTKEFKDKKNIDESLSIENNEIVEKIEELIINAISKQLFADVPVGIFLSGGVDSTLLLALIKNAGLPMIPSFSIIHKKKEKTFGTEDFKYAKKAAALYGSYQYEIEVDIEDLNNFDAFVNDLDQPIGDSAAFLTYKLSQEAKKKVGVILSGAGADEVFAGYHRHHAFKWYLNYYNSIKRLSPAFKYLLAVLPTGYNHPLRKNLQLLNKFIRNYSPNPRETFINFTSLSISHENFSAYDHNLNFYQDIEANLKDALTFDRKNFLHSDILALTDQMSMKHALEIRVPYLDINLIDFVDNLPAKQLFSGGRKWILNKILYKYGGEIFVKRKKEGMGLPFGNWIRQAPNNNAMQFITGKSCILCKFLPEEKIQKLINDHVKGRADNTLEIWAIVVLEAWLQKEFN